jgi:hypothetical protein
VISSLGIVGTVLLLPSGVSAQTSKLLPEQIQEIFDLFGRDGTGTASFISGRVRTGLYIALGMIVLVAVIYALIAAFKYIQSQGDPGKIEEAQKAIKAIFMGIAAMLIGIVGVVLVFVFFGAGRVDPNLTQVCLSAPNSQGCEQCQIDVESGACLACEDIYADIAGADTDAELTNEELQLDTTFMFCKDPLDGGVAPNGGTPPAPMPVPD